MAHLVPPSGPGRLRLTFGSFAVGTDLLVVRVELVVFFDDVVVLLAVVFRAAVGLLMVGSTEKILLTEVSGVDLVVGAANDAAVAPGAAASMRLVTVTVAALPLAPQATTAPANRHPAASLVTPRMTRRECRALTGCS